MFISPQENRHKGGRDDLNSVTEGCLSGWESNGRTSEICWDRMELEWNLEKEDSDV